MSNRFTDTFELTELQNEDVSFDTEGAAPDAEEDSGHRLERYKPDGSRIKLYMDFDNSFIVMYPVIHLGEKEYQIDLCPGKDTVKVELFVLSLCSYLGNYQFHRSKYFPALLTMPAFYADDVLEFMLEVIPRLLKVAAIYYTENFKRVMIKKSLRMNISSSQGSIDRYLECDFSYDTGISPFELAEMMKAIDNKDQLRFFQLRSGGFIDLRAEKVKETLVFLQKFGVTLADLENRKIQIPRCEIPYAAALFEQADAQQAVEFTGLDIKSLEKRVFEIRNSELKLPRGLNCELRPYQREGFRWLKELLLAGLGGILADDMGLGKTLQAIALILSEFEEKGGVKALVVVPTSLIDNWISELTKFAPALKCVGVTGSAETRNEIVAAWRDYDVFITSYGLAVNDIGKYKNKALDILILDEAQKIKNHLSKTAKEIRKIKAANKFALTGTPLENNLAELWSIFNWLMPPLLKDFADF